MIFENNDNTYNKNIVYNYATKKNQIYRIESSYRIGKHEKSNSTNHFPKKKSSKKKKIL